MVRKLISKISIDLTIAIAIGATIIPAGLATADTSSVDYIFLIDSNRQNCQQIGEEYREIKAFETENFYVNICQKADNYYYLGEAKTGAISTIFVPANALNPGEMYRANNGNVSYIVNILPSRSVLIVERNGAEVERETSLQKQCLDPENSLSVSLPTQIYYPMSDARILTNDTYLELDGLESIDFTNLDRFNSSVEYNRKTILNLPNCEG